jgi:hypothetical protein
MHLIETSLAHFVRTVGSDQAVEILGLWENTSLTHLVLFTDDSGVQMAVLPVGPTQQYRSVDRVAAAVLDGMHPRTFIPTRIGEFQERNRELTHLDATLRAREAYIAECEARVARVTQALSEREAQIEQREVQLQDEERAFFARLGEEQRKRQSAVL